MEPTVAAVSTVRWHAAAAAAAARPAAVCNDTRSTATAAVVVVVVTSVNSSMLSSPSRRHNVIQNRPISEKTQPSLFSWLYTGTTVQNTHTTVGSLGTDSVQTQYRLSRRSFWRETNSVTLLVTPPPPQPSTPHNTVQVVPALRAPSLHGGLNTGYIYIQ